MNEKCYNNLRNLRREKNYSQEYMANELNISQKAYSDIENGKTALKHHLIRLLTQILNTTPDKLCQVSTYCKDKYKEKNEKLVELLNKHGINIPQDLI